MLKFDCIVLAQGRIRRNIGERGEEEMERSGKRKKKEGLRGMERIRKAKKIMRMKEKKGYPLWKTTLKHFIY